MNKPIHTIAIDARPLLGSWNGTTTYLQTVVEILLANNFHITLLSDRPLSNLPTPFKKCKSVVIGSTANWRWQQIDVRRHLKTHNYDIYYVGSNKGLPLFYFGKTRLVLGLLDIIPIVLYRIYLLRPPFKSIFTYLLPQIASILKADTILTISEKSGADIKRLFPFKQVTAILMKLPDTIKPTRASKRIDQFTYVGGVDPRKQLVTLLEAFKKFLVNNPSFKLIFIGKDYIQLEPHIQNMGLADNVVLTGFVSDHEKMKLLSQSRAMVYPSLYEGYGLQSAEAMLANTPVIAGGGGAQHEVGGRAVLSIDPTNSDDIALKMEQVLDASVSSKLVELGKKQVKKLTAPELNSRLADFFIKQATQEFKK